MEARRDLSATMHSSVASGQWCWKFFSSSAEEGIAYTHPPTKKSEEENIDV
jgi:hypothetical protein